MLEMTESVNYFEEKSIQVEPYEIRAFGIEIRSRYGTAHEIIQMLNFAQKCARSDINHYVKEVDYDGKSGICFFTFDPNVKPGDPIGKMLFEYAKQFISQFDWYDGTVQWGAENEIHDKST